MFIKFYYVYEDIIMILSLFFSLLYAQGSQSTPSKGPSTLELLILPLGFLLIMYFLIIRPQSKKIKDHENLIASLKIGDEVVTSGGLIGKVKNITDNFISIEVSSNSVIKVLKSHISSKTKQDNVLPNKNSNITSNK